MKQGWVTQGDLVALGVPTKEVEKDPENKKMRTES